MANEKPPEAPTVTLPAATPTDILLKKMSDGFEGINSRLNQQDETLLSQDGKLDKVVDESIRTNVRLEKLESRADETESRLSRTSSRVKDESSADMARDLRLAEAILKQKKLEDDAAEAARKASAALVKVDALEVKTDTSLMMLQELVDISKKPMVRKIAYTIGLLVLGWLASKGIKVPL